MNDYARAPNQSLLTTSSPTFAGLTINGAATFAATVTATGQFLAGDGSEAAPAHSFTNYSTSGMYVFVGGVGLSYNGLRASITALGLHIHSSQALGWSNGGAGATMDVVLTRDAANVLAQKNGTNAQTLRVYGTTTGPKYAGIAHDGTDRSYFSATEHMYFNVGGLNRWWISSAGDFLAVTDNANDIGASGASRPRNVYVAGTIIAGVKVEAGAASYLGFTGRSLFSSPSDGVVLVSNNAANDFGRLCFGGTTSAFPALKRSGTTIQVRVADDTGYGSLAAYDFQMFGNALYDASANKVVGAQGAAVADATGAGDVVAQLNTLLARLRAHGLIST